MNNDLNTIVRHLSRETLYLLKDDNSTDVEQKYDYVVNGTIRDMVLERVRNRMNNTIKVGSIVTRNGQEAEVTDIGNDGFGPVAMLRYLDGGEFDKLGEFEIDVPFEELQLHKLVEYKPLEEQDTFERTVDFERYFKSGQRMVNQKEIVAYYVESPNRTENEMQEDVYDYYRGKSYESNKKYADCLRRALDNGYLKREYAMTSIGMRYLYSATNAGKAFVGAK